MLLKIACLLIVSNLYLQSRKKLYKRNPQNIQFTNLLKMPYILKGPEIKSRPLCGLGEFFFNCGERLCDKICQIDGILDKKESFKSVRERSVRLALELQKRGLTSEDVVVVCSRVTLDTIIPIIGTFYLGAKIANLDPTLSARQTTHLISLVTPKFIFVENESVGLIEESLGNLSSQIVTFRSGTKYPNFEDFSKKNNNERDFKPVKIDLHDTAVLFFSSGTTGLPKAICHSHYSFINLGFSMCENGVDYERVLSFTSFYWISGMMMLFNTFLTGGCRIFCGPLDPKTTFEVIEKYKITFLFLAPVLSYKLTNYEDNKKYDKSSVRIILVGGTPISPAQLQRLGQLFKKASIIFGYGLTEVGAVTMLNPERDQELLKKNNRSCGKPAPGVLLKVVDLSTNLPLGPNEKGEIRVKTPSLMSGYFKVGNTEFDDDGFLKTGDIGYYDQDQCLYVIERLKEMFKYMSWHIVPSSIEAVLLEHPAVKEAVVFGIPKNEEEGELPAACLVLHQNNSVSKEEIETFLNSRVSDREKLRGGIFFVDEIDKTPSGKAKRKEIRSCIITSLTK